MEADKLIKKIHEIDKEIFTIFEMVSDEKNISIYKSSLLSVKIDILANMLEKTYLDLLSQETIKLNRLMFFGKLSLFMFLINTILTFFAPIIGCSLNALNLIWFTILNKKSNNELPVINKIEEITDNYSNYEVTIENCRTFLRAHTDSKIEYKTSELNDLELKRIDLANEHIELALVDGVSDNIPDEVRNIMVKMLQQELKTNETNLENLLNMLVDGTDNLQNGEDLSRKRTKNK